ncbi:MAG: NusA-like transcription termination signal-binding factor [Candidatus Woesearchaeota archaeon]|nr:NusA-like transcription termination signal-binding factor [Candidatus Woesearchaeota archaeon]
MILDKDLLQTITLVEQKTRARVDQCLPKDDKLVFIVGKGDARKMVGPGGATLKKLEEQLGKKLKIIEKNPDKFTFVQNAMLPLRIETINEENGIITVHGRDEKTRGLMIGAKAKNLRFTEKVVQMYFPDVQEIKVV